jgi:hypothetical protein
MQQLYESKWLFLKGNDYFAVTKVGSRYYFGPKVETALKDTDLRGQRKLKVQQPRHWDERIRRNFVEANIAIELYCCGHRGGMSVEA